MIKMERYFLRRIESVLSNKNALELRLEYFVSSETWIWKIEVG